jgi:hypothetical protein
MNAIDQLKEIVASQQSIRTSRLAPLLKEIETMYINQGKKIKRQQVELNKFNRKWGGNHMSLTAEHYRIAKQNGISRDTAYYRHHKAFWDIDRAITEPSRVYRAQRDLAEYAVYKGEELICIGNADECSERLGILKSSFYFYLSAAYQRKVAKRKKDFGNRLEIVRLDDEGDEWFGGTKALSAKGPQTSWFTSLEKYKTFKRRKN